MLCCNRITHLEHSMKRSLFLLSLLATPCILNSCGDDNGSVATSTQIEPADPAHVYKVMENRYCSNREKEIFRDGYNGKEIDFKKIERDHIKIYCSGAGLGGHSKLIFRAINSEQDEEYTDRYVRSAAFGAAAGGHTELAELLVKKGASKLNVLEGAALGKQMTVIETTLDQLKNEPNYNSKRHKKAASYILRGAAEGGHMDLVEKMLEEGAEPTKGFEGAAEGGQLEIAQLLLRKGAYMHDSIKLAAKGGHIELVKLILDNSKNFELDVSDGLHSAAEGGHMDIIKLLLDKGGNPNDALESTARNGHIDILKLLLNEGANPAGALRQAAYGGHIEIVQMMLERGSDPNKEYALHAATSGNHSKIVKLLLKQPNINLFLRDRDGQSPLDIAQANEFKECAELILAAIEEQKKQQ